MTDTTFNQLSRKEKEEFIRRHDPTPQGLINCLIKKDLKIFYIYAPGYNDIQIIEAQPIDAAEYEAMRMEHDFAVHCLDGHPDMRGCTNLLSKQN
jgi:hypothetical protein